MDFLKNNKRFSFLLGGKNAWDTPYTCESEQTENTLIVTYQFAGGLKITNTATKYEKFGAYEWVNTIENTTDIPSEIISELWDCDCCLPMPSEAPFKRSAYYPEAVTKVNAPKGSEKTSDEFYCDEDCLFSQIDTSLGTKVDRAHHIYVGQTKRYATSGGRSSEKNAPFFNVNKEGKGYIFGIGWSGQWQSEVTRGENNITFRSKIEDTHFRVNPGEKFRTSSVVIMPYTGDVTAAQNKWRRLIKTHFSPIGKESRPKMGPLCTSVWGGLESKKILARIEKIKEYDLPFEYLWIDAGWCGAETEPTLDEFGGDWKYHTGDWVISHKIHPEGMRDISGAVHDAGKKFLLWFEPERVIKTVPKVLSNPEYFLFHPDPENINCLLNLGLEDAWQYCFATLSKFIEELGIDCYRQDFNIAPLEIWRANDSDDRRGITEIKHINGLYRLWDALLAEFPHLLIDNCASGGRRIDIETLRRSVPLWRSDLQCPANYSLEATQCHHRSFSSWIPYSGTTAGRETDVYRVRSAYGTAMGSNFFYSENEADFSPEKMAFIKKYMNEYLQLRPYFSEDFYPLTDFSDKTDTWFAAQFDRPEKGDGILQVFRRENSPYESATFILGGIDKEKKYLFTDADGGAFTVDGKTLCDIGLTLSIAEKRTAKIYFYKSI